MTSCILDRPLFSGCGGGGGGEKGGGGAYFRGRAILKTITHAPNRGREGGGGGGLEFLPGITNVFFHQVLDFERFILKGFTHEEK